MDSSSSALKGNKNGLLVATLLVLTALISSFSTRAYITKSAGTPDLSQEYLYFQRYQQTDRYKQNPKYLDSNPFDIDTTYHRLIKAFPYTKTPGGIPKNIFQMWISPEPVPENDLPYPDFRKTWKEQNPDHNYTVLSWEAVRDAAKEAFETTVPEVWEVLESMPLVILRSDFSRYLMLYLNGGVWADLDTGCDRPISKWFHNTIDSDIRFVGSVEHDLNSERWPSLTSRRLQFENWAFTSDNFHPALAMVIAHVVRMHFIIMYEGHLDMYTKEDGGGNSCHKISVIDWTGPGIFSDGIYRYMNTAEKRVFQDMDFDRYNSDETLVGPGTGEKINWRGFSGLVAPVVFNNDVCILPKSGFRCKNDFDESLEEYCYLTHYFSHSWFKEVD
ncbi:hypothetical protein OGAPHI_004929 [Ogataea philodendri]|uniref:Mannosyltransferase n=1 Tax=Ogataea philodendri TaxID=1378263 RepID=A0A9P8T264_9ASCO|nr:uncharacterized protein OGAPHI_004929 [Ogataea philodendri]KAH3663528.1 hypothetical protein OGAPHI_004929 [Ogataea philodendri]